MNGPPIVIARPPGQFGIALLVIGSALAVLSTMLLLRYVRPVATAWGDVVDQQMLSRYGVDPLAGRQTLIARMPRRLVDAAERGAASAEFVVEAPTGDGGVRRVPGTFVKRWASSSAHGRGTDATDEQHCLVLIAFVAPAGIAAGSRVVVRARLAPSVLRSPGWLASL